MEQQRQSLARDSLRECLLQEIGRLLGKDAHGLGDKITFVRMKGQPNWSAEIDIVSTIQLSAYRQLSAFRQALKNTRAIYNLD
jgi:hypothetical protein